ncbi:hypothetical protein [Streptomyces sp. SID13031]|uniref:hypothetical protein n=1 Tax=Streptomyces sp. SID13031 TaxID=2706046 RepID=UPI0013CD67B7|nr:hypothetical protein [Streptomyces sp. SID13031]NEA34702.1 hypothetical protein [Streptomyces sp. SID13031]
MKRLAALTAVLAVLLTACTSDPEPQAETTPLAGPDGKAVEVKDTTRELVVWADTVCGAIKALQRDHDLPTDALQAAAVSPYTGIAISTYLQGAADMVERYSEVFGQLEPSGVAAGDKVVTGIVERLHKVRPEVSTLSNPSANMTEPSPADVQRMKQVLALMKTVEPPASALADAAKTDPRLTTAYQLAPQCDPAVAKPTPGATLPPAKDKSNFAACQDGTCQVLVGKTELFMAGTHTLSITVVAGSVAIRDRFGGNGSGINLLRSVGSSARLGDRKFGAVTTIKVAALAHTTAVLTITTV